VGEIASVLAGRGTSRAEFDRAWRETWSKFSSLNRLLLRPPP